MREIRTSGLMSGEGKRNGARYHAPLRPSSTLLRRQKNDAADAAGICEAVTRPSMRFTGVRTLENQAALMHHKAREMLVAQRTQLINALRGHLAEIGVIAAQGLKNARELARVILAEGDETIPACVRAALAPLVRQLHVLDQEIACSDRTIAAMARDDEMARRLMTMFIFVMLGIAAIFRAAVGQNTAEPYLLFVEERHDAIVQEIGCRDWRFAIIELCECELRIGVDKGLLVNAADPFHVADVERVLGAAVARAFALELAVRLLFGFGFLQGDDLRLGQDQAFLRNLGFQRLEPLLHRLEIMALPDAAHPGW